MFSKLKKVKGFTIMEALIAFGVFALGALAVAAFLSRSVEMNADSEARTEALHLAKEAIAGFRDFSTRAEVVAYTTDSTGNTIVGNNATFTRTWTVADVTGNTNAVLVTVDVDWTGVNGPQNVSLSSEIAKLRPERTGAFMMAKSVKLGTGNTTITFPTTTTGTTTSTDGTTTSTAQPTTTSSTSTTNSTSTTSSTTSTTKSTTTTITTTTTATTTTTNTPILYNCTCVWEGSTSGTCGDLKSVSSSPSSANSCCSASSCAPYKPEGNKICKKQDGVATFSCSGSL